MRILLTGFGPFGDVVDNPSARIARHFGDCGHSNHELTSAVFPVSFRRADAEVRGLLRNGNFDVALLTGVAGNAARFRLETLAANEDRARIPDRDGESPQDTAIIEGFGDSLHSPVNLASIHVALIDLGFPVDISSDAGRYVCNRTYFAALHEIAVSRLTTQCLFLHVPPDERAFGETDDRPFAPFELQIRFVDHLITVLTENV